MAMDSLDDSAERQPTSVRHRWLWHNADQVAIAGLVLLALAGMGVYWLVQGGCRGGLVEIDRAEKLEARFQVDLNSADWPELAQLPGIGETLARRIVEFRRRQGRLVRHDDLLEVHGIGPVTLDRVRPYLRPMGGNGALGAAPGRADR